MGARGGCFNRWRDPGDGRLSEITASGSWPRREEGRGKNSLDLGKMFFFFFALKERDLSPFIDPLKEL